MNALPNGTNRFGIKIIQETINRFKSQSTMIATIAHGFPAVLNVIGV